MGVKFFLLLQTVPEAHLASWKVSTGSLPRGYIGRGVAFITHPSRGALRALVISLPSN